MPTSIRLRTTGSLQRPVVGGSGGLTAGTAVSVKCAFFRRKLQQVVGDVGEVHQVSALAFVKATVDVERRDQLTVAGEVFVVLQVIPATDDRGVTDHIGLQLGSV